MLMSKKSVSLLDITKNTVIYELIYTAIKCDVNSCIFREYSSYLSFCSNIIAFPLIIFTSILGIVSTMQTVEIEDTESDSYLYTNSNVKIVISFFSICVAIMSGLQKYCKFSERAEITKNYAKNFEKLGYSIEIFLYEIKNNTITTQTELFDRLLNNILKDFEVLITECDDQPCNMVQKQAKLYNEKSKILLEKNTKNEHTTNSCKSCSNCCNFLCNCCEFVIDIDPETESNLEADLVKFKNLDHIIRNLQKNNNNVVQPNMQPNMQPVYPLLRYN